MANGRPKPSRASPQSPSQALRRWSSERDAHLRQINAFSFVFPSRTKRSATKMPAALRYAAHLPAGRLVRGLLAMAAPAYTILQISQGESTWRAIGFALLLTVVILLVSTYRVTVGNYGISFDIAGLRQVSSFGFLPLYAIREAVADRLPEDWPKARLKGGWWPGRRRVNVLHLDDNGVARTFYVWVSDPDAFGTALLGRPMSEPG